MKIRYKPLVSSRYLNNVVPPGTPGEALSFEWDYDDSGDKVPVFHCFFYGYTDVHQLTLDEIESL